MPPGVTPQFPTSKALNHVTKPDFWENGINYQAPKHNFTVKLRKLKLLDPPVDMALFKTLAETIDFIHNFELFYLKRLSSVI